MLCKQFKPKCPIIMLCSNICEPIKEEVVKRMRWMNDPKYSDSIVDHMLNNHSCYLCNREDGEHYICLIDNSPVLMMTCVFCRSTFTISKNTNGYMKITNAVNSKFSIVSKEIKTFKKAFDLFKHTGVI